MGAREHLVPVEAFCGSGIDRREGETIWLATVHGPERCDLGDWIIEGVEDFYATIRGPAGYETGARNGLMS